MARALPAGFPPKLGQLRQLPLPGIERLASALNFISADALHESLGAKPPVIIDLRGAGEFATAHVAGARWLSRGWLELKIAEMARRDDRVVVYSRHETRSVLAASALAELGYRDVAVLHGGFENWRQRGLRDRRRRRSRKATSKRSRLPKSGCSARASSATATSEWHAI